MRQKNSIYCWRNPGEGLEEGGVAVVGPAAVEEEAEPVDREQVAQGPLPVRAAERRHLHRRPHLIPPAATDGDGKWSWALEMEGVRASPAVPLYPSRSDF